MIRASHLAIVVIVLILCAEIPAQTAAESSDEYSVYNAVIAHMFAGDKVTFDTQSKVKRVVIRDRTTTDYAWSEKGENWSQVKIRLPKLADDTITNYEANLKTSTELKPAFSFGLTYSIFSKKDYDTVFDAQGDFDRTSKNWESFYKKFPESGGHISFSNIGLNKSGNQALVYFVHWCGSLCGTGHYVLLMKNDNKWLVDSIGLMWIS